MRKLIIILFLSNAAVSFSQEQLYDLYTNPVLQQKWKVLPAPLKVAPTPAASLSLPFMDDFSRDSVYPDNAKWMDMKVFINRNFPVAPPSIGVATFDGLDADGIPYDTTGTFNPASSAYADTLTSYPIDLFGKTPADSVRLSFYYEAGGKGNLPEVGDSLWLEFKSPAQTWTKVWTTPGFSAAPSDSNFQQVMIYISSPAFLVDSFQFRFRNKATLSGNLDHWNLDYVYLNDVRPATDTAYKDIAFVYDAQSLLKQYIAMPWEQYDVNDMKTSIKNYLRNNYTSTFTTSNYEYFIEDMNHTVLSNVNGSFSLQPYYPNGYTTCTPIPCANILNPPVSYSYQDTMTGCYIYHVHHSLDSNATDVNHNNDSVTFYQKFLNYYAYDDGTAEKGYGLNVIGGQTAYKFTLNTADQFTDVDMFFTFLMYSQALRTFRITIWDATGAGGTPGNIIYQDSIVSPHYVTGMNQFYRYKLTSPVNLPAGSFYVGMVQYSSTELNIGFDANTNSQSKMYYRTGVNWVQTIFKGSWMIRPVFGRCTNWLGVADVSAEVNLFYVYPNPAQDILFVKSENDSNEKINFSVFDMLGNEVISQKGLSGSSVDISALKNGIYFIRIVDAKGNAGVKKIVVSK